MVVRFGNLQTTNGSPVLARGKQFLQQTIFWNTLTTPQPNCINLEINGKRNVIQRLHSDITELCFRVAIQVDLLATSSLTPPFCPWITTVASSTYKDLFDPCICNLC